MKNEKIISDKLDEVLFWTKFSVWRPFTSLLKSILKDDVTKLVYELSDGKRSTREIAKLVSNNIKRITHVTVSNYWEKWNELSILLPGTRIGRYRKVVSLKTIGVKIPDLSINFEE